MKNNGQPDLILASKSLRRKDLLETTGLKIRIIPSSIVESSFQVTSPAAYAKVLAKAKAEDVAGQHPDNWVLGADTIVVVGGRILGKPRDKAQARRMLESLSGQKHQVYTGFTLCHRKKARQFTDVVKTDVYFKDLRSQEIDWYIATGEPFDKAGGYGIQGIGAFIVKKINGSYTNVVGLPVCEVMELLNQEGICP